MWGRGNAKGEGEMSTEFIFNFRYYGDECGLTPSEIEIVKDGITEERQPSMIMRDVGRVAIIQHGHVYGIERAIKARELLQKYYEEMYKHTGEHYSNPQPKSMNIPALTQDALKAEVNKPAWKHKQKWNKQIDNYEDTGKADYDYTARDIVRYFRIGKYNKIGGKYRFYFQPEGFENLHIPINAEGLRHLVSSLPDSDTIDITPNTIKETAKMIEYRSRNVEGWDLDTNLINLKNGMYNVKDGSLTPHHEVKNHSLMQCPGNYNPDAPQPKRFDQWMNDVTQGDKETRHELLDAFAQVIDPNGHLGKLYFLIGGQGTGKSTAQDFLESFVGDTDRKTNYHSVETLQQTGSRFGGSMTIDKYLNSARDNSYEVSVKSVEKLKLMATDEPTSVEIKGVSLADTGPTPPTRTLNVYSLNMWPIFEKSSLDDSGFIERLKFIQFHVQFRDTKRENRDIAKEILAEELDGIVTHRLIPRIIENRKRMLKPKYQKTVSEIRAELQGLLYDLGEFKQHCIFDAAHETTSKLMLERYKAHCINTQTEYSEKKLSKWLNSNGAYKIRGNRKGKRVQMWKGVSLVDNGNGNGNSITEYTEDAPTVETKTKPTVETKTKPTVETKTKQGEYDPTNWPEGKPTPAQVRRQAKDMSIPANVTNVIIRNLDDHDYDVNATINHAVKFWDVQDATTQLKQKEQLVAMLCDWFNSS